MHFAEGSLGLPVIAKLMMTMETRDGTKPLDQYIAKELALDFSYIEKTYPYDHTLLAMTLPLPI